MKNKSYFMSRKDKRTASTGNKTYREKPRHSAVTYKFSDIDTQKAILREQLNHLKMFNPVQYERTLTTAIEKLTKRVNKFYNTTY